MGEAEVLQILANHIREEARRRNDWIEFDDAIEERRWVVGVVRDIMRVVQREHAV